jgi:ABC-type branched-subunit amino acid transport system substrate-binding protein
MLIDVVRRLNKPQWTFQASIAVLVLLAFSLAVGCKKTPTVYKIGLVGPFDGRHREIGYDVIYSARLAIREENLRLESERYRVALVAQDDFGDPDTANEIARSLVIDPGVIAVIGHWLPETTAAAAPVYEEAGLLFIPAGVEPFGPTTPETLPSDFRQKYAEITPFDEVAGAYAGAGYDSLRLVHQALSQLAALEESIDRNTVAKMLAEVTHDGITGHVYVP